MSIKFYLKNFDLNSVFANELKLFFLVVMFSTPVVFSQTKERHPDTERFANEVFKECTQYLNDELLDMYSVEISKVKVVKMKKSVMPEMPKLSTIGLKNKCNSELNREFDKDDFNPLKYFMNFYSTSDQYIRVDDTKFVIFIKGKN